MNLQRFLKCLIHFFFILMYVLSFNFSCLESYILCKETIRYKSSCSQWFHVRNWYNNWYWLGYFGTYHFKRTTRYRKERSIKWDCKKIIKCFFKTNKAILNSLCRNQNKSILIVIHIFTCIISYNLLTLLYFLYYYSLSFIIIQILMIHKHQQAYPSYESIHYEQHNHFHSQLHS